jgi:hypothetical protein
MQLSTAIREGARRSAPLHHTSHQSLLRSEQGRLLSDAFGAAALAVALSPDELTQQEVFPLLATFPELTTRVRSPAIIGWASIQECILSCITQGWSRERIADWVEAQGC